MKIKLDENLSARLVTAIAALGHDVDTAGMEGLGGKPDDNVAQAASAAGRVLFTQDGDFADVRRFAPGTHPGIVLFRSPSRSVRLLERLIEWFLKSELPAGVTGRLVIVEPWRIRVRSADLGDD